MQETRRRGIRLCAAAGALAVAAVALATPAMASPAVDGKATTLVGSGSDTTHAVAATRRRLLRGSRLRGLGTYGDATTTERGLLLGHSVGTIPVNPDHDG